MDHPGAAEGGGGQADSAVALLPERRSLSALREAAAECRGALMHETKDELYELARRADVAGRSSMTKRELAAALADRPLPD